MIEPRQKCKVLIKSVVKDPSCGGFLKPIPIQNRNFSFGIRIRNIGDAPFPGGTVSNVIIKSGETKNLGHSSHKTFNVSVLNPGKEQEIIFENLITSLYGIVFLHLDIHSSVDIEMFQFDEANKEPIALSSTNHWCNSIFIISAFENQQSVTNRWIIGLTIITLIQGIWGIRDFIKFVWNLLIIVSSGVASSFSYIINFLSHSKPPL